MPDTVSKAVKAPASSGDFGHEDENELQTFNKKENNGTQQQKKSLDSTFVPRSLPLKQLFLHSLNMPPGCSHCRSKMTKKTKLR